MSPLPWYMSRQTEQKNGQNRQRYSHIEPVSLHSEGKSRKCHARDGSKNQQQQPQLNHPATPSGKRVTNYTGNTPQVTRFAVERPVVGMGTAMMNQKHQSACQYECGRDYYTHPEEVANDLFRPPIVPVSPVGSHSLRVTPLKIISIPKRTITAPNT